MAMSCPMRARELKRVGGVVFRIRIAMSHTLYVCELKRISIGRGVIRIPCVSVGVFLVFYGGEGCVFDEVDSECGDVLLYLRLDA